MRQTSGNGSVVMARAMLLRTVCLVVVIAGLVVPTATTRVKAQTRYIASPVTWFLDTKHVDDKLYPDYVVEFEIPTGATNIFVYTTFAY